MEVITGIELGENKMQEEIFKKCNFLFYELKVDDSNIEVDGGYKVELSFEEKQNDYTCGIRDLIIQGPKP